MYDDKTNDDQIVNNNFINNIQNINDIKKNILFKKPEPILHKLI